MNLKNLFFVFDPSPLYSLNYSWGSLIIILMLIPFNKLKKWSVNSTLLHLKKMYIFNEMKVIVNYNMNFMLVSMLMLIIIYVNVMGLFPYVFTNTSHLVMTLSLGLPLWMGPILFKILNYLDSFLSHLIPQGTPPSMLIFMILVESVSLLIRPLTLSVRLAANIMAGHLLITLMSNQAVSLMGLSSFVIMSQMILLSLEFIISFIQAYVFTMLSALYISENI